MTLSVFSWPQCEHSHKTVVVEQLRKLDELIETGCEHGKLLKKCCQRDRLRSCFLCALLHAQAIYSDWLSSPGPATLGLYLELMTPLHLPEQLVC
jgi:hypothetical protein